MSRPLRNALSAVLIALACLLAPLGALSAWAAYGLADTDRYVTTMAPLADDPDVREAVADTVGDGIMREVDRRRTVVRPLRGTVAPFVHDAVRSLTRTEAFRTAWNEGNRATHDAVLRALRGERDRAVTVDLAPVTVAVKRHLVDAHVALADHIPVRHARVPVLAAEDLGRLRKGYGVLEVAGFWLPVAACVFAVAGIGLAVRRRRAITATGLGTAAGGALLALAVALGRRLTLDDLPAEVSQRAAGAVYDALTSTLRTAAWLLLALGLTVAVGAQLARRHLARRRAEAAASVAAQPQEPPRARI
ncbi:hypothetical protein [Streptomyces adustus]|uniref:hypothetical protein n=1 Tax=Streptomyces adustus TaxID=1609272 RepID=UPI00371D341E